jgi:hypothetical protein
VRLAELIQVQSFAGLGHCYSSRWAEPADANCPNDGVALEIDGSALLYMCNGAPGAAGDSVVISPDMGALTCHLGESRRAGSGVPTAESRRREARLAGDLRPFSVASAAAIE